jgi:hypothetical protein
MEPRSWRPRSPPPQLVRRLRAQTPDDLDVDVDVVHRRGADNVERLLAFLEAVDARYRGRPPPTIRSCSRSRRPTRKRKVSARVAASSPVRSAARSAAWSRSRVERARLPAPRASRRARATTGERAVALQVHARRLAAEPEDQAGRRMEPQGVLREEPQEHRPLRRAPQDPLQRLEVESERLSS